MSTGMLLLLLWVGFAVIIGTTHTLIARWRAAGRKIEEARRLIGPEAARLIHARQVTGRQS